MLILAGKAYGDRKYLLNTSGIIYRSIGAKVVKKMTDKDFFENLSKEPRLIKRPFLYVSDNSFLVGFKEEKWTEKLILNWLRKFLFDYIMILIWLYKYSKYEYLW